MIDMLTRALPLTWRPFSAKLTGVSGFTGRGSVSFLIGGDGAKKLVVDLQGVAGREADVVANDQTAVTVKIVKGRANATFTSKRGAKLPDLGDGARIDIRQNGDIILSGVLSRS